MEGKLKILGTNLNWEEILYVYLIFCVFGDFYCDVLYRKRPCLVGKSKMQSPGISTVLHWQLSNVRIFGTDPSPLWRLYDQFPTHVI